GADWVLVLDADEFVVVADDGPLIPADADPERPLALPWRTYVPDAGDDATEINPVRRLRRRLVKEPTQWRKLMVPRLLALRADGWLTAGAHQFLLGDRPCRPALAKHAHLAHFPVR